MTVDEVMNTLRSRFTSGNSVPVSQARITAEEYAVLRQYINVVMPMIEADCRPRNSGWEKMVNGEQLADRLAFARGVLPEPPEGV